MTRRCSHCSNNGHNSRTCPTTRGVKLFGVRLIADHHPGHGGGGGMKKSASMGSISHYYSSQNTASPPSDHLPVSADPGYASDGPASCSSSCRGGGGGGGADRKKGTPWTEEEHRLFLLGLQKLGKGDWRGIARNFVITRTPTQVASHAQKYFIRQSNSTRRKRRSSLFDMVPNMPIDQMAFPGEPLGPSQMTEAENVNQFGNLTLSLDGNFEPMESTSQTQSIPTVVEESMPCDSQPVDAAFPPTYLPVLFPFIPSNIIPVSEEVDMEPCHHQVIKPTPILPKEAVNADELVCMSKLTIGPSGIDRIEPSPLSLKLTGSSRQSAFHTSQPVNRSDLGNMDGNAIPAV